MKQDIKKEPQPKFVIGIMGKAGAGKDTVANIILNKIGYGKKYSFADPLKKMCSEVFDIPIEWMYDQDLKKREVIINLENPYTISMMEEWVYQEIHLNPKWRWVIAKPELSGIGEGMRYQQVAQRLFGYLNDELSKLVNAYKAKSYASRTYRVSVRLILQIMGTEIIRNNIGDTFWAEIKEEIDEKTTYILPDCRFETELDYVLSFPESMIIVVDNNDLDSSATDGHVSEELVGRVDEYLEERFHCAYHVMNNLKGDYDSLVEDLEKLIIPKINFQTEIKGTYAYDNA